MMLRSSDRKSRTLRLESLDDRRMLTASVLTPTEAIAQLNAQSAIAATLATQTQNLILATQSGLLNVAKQLDADNLRNLSQDTARGNTQQAVVDLQERNTIIAAEQRITSEFATMNTNLLSANQTFRNQSTALVTGVSRGTIAPTTALLTQTTDYEAFKSVAVGSQSQAATDNSIELVNLSGLVSQIEGVSGVKSLGTFSGKFDAKEPGPTTGVLTDFEGVATTHLTLSANLLQGIFTAATTDYLQAYATVGTTTQLVKQPITGGTILAAVSTTIDSSGFNIHGNVQLNLGPIDNLLPSTQTFQIAAKLTGTTLLTGNFLQNGQVVGSFSWVL